MSLLHDRRISMFAGLVLLPLTLAAPRTFAVTSGINDLKTAISCTAPIKPGKILGELLHEHIIGSLPHNVVDGIPVYAVATPFRIEGFTVKFVEGWDYEKSWTNKDNLFERAPGTAPGTMIGITVKGDKQAAQERFPSILDEVHRGGSLLRVTRYVDDKPSAYAYHKHDGMVTIVCSAELQ